MQGRQDWPLSCVANHSILERWLRATLETLSQHEREDRRTKIGDPLVGLTKHVDFEALADGVDAAAPRPSAEIIDGEPSGVAKFSDREIFEKYKAGRAIIAAGI